MGPDNLGAPDDLEAAIIAFIGGARESLDIAVQELESESIARAILDARARGVRVRVAVEGDYLSVRTPAVDPFAPGGENEANRMIHAALLRAKVPVITDLNPKIFHQKFIVRDPDSSRTALLTGSTNFTPTDVSVNLNHLVVIRSRRVADAYQEEFEEIWSGTFGVKRERHDPEPKECRVSGVRVKVLFAPDHAPEMEIMKQMLKAKKRVDFAMFTFARSSGIDDTLIALKKAGIEVRGILDRGQGNREWAATKGLAKAGVEIYLTRSGGGLRKLHHKLVVIDGQAIIGGSFNYTEPATMLNDENIVVIGDLEETNDEADRRQKRLASHALGEIDRIIGMHGAKLRHA